MGVTRPFYGKHIVSAKQFTRDSILHVMAAADQVHNSLKVMPQVNLLHGKVLGSCFLEPSTRTATSFEVAMLRLVR